ncbi:hypothetical protein HanLR1_Chr06g0227611 [Helianthus annuus]|nr:hypothetical protein HanLR1_Chr06g0227611 [Helianthus annuus]
MQMLEDNPQITSGVQLSVVQGYMAKNFPVIWNMGCEKSNSHLGFINGCLFFFLSVGLVSFNVETRPEKLWVGHGSRAAEEETILRQPPGTVLQNRAASIGNQTSRCHI